jgi:hypothetical protein
VNRSNAESLPAPDSLNQHMNALWDSVGICPGAAGAGVLVGSVVNE